MILHAIINKSMARHWDVNNCDEESYEVVKEKDH